MKGRELAHAYTRRVLEQAQRADDFEPIAVRAAFLHVLLSAASIQLASSARDADVIRELLCSVVEDETEQAILSQLRRSVGHLDEVPLIVQRDPALIGWCYQSWNEPLRAQSSWAISTRSEQQAEGVDVGVVTQVFTDDYIADFIVERCLSLISRERRGEFRSARICDPACGVGHFLLAAIRMISRDQKCPLSIARNLWGFDIDPHAVRLARALVFLELIRRGFAGDLHELWTVLSSQIVCLDAPHGTLRRESIELRGSQSFDIVVTNPPYLGRRKLPFEMRRFLDAEYPHARVDLCAAFMQRCIELTTEGGVLGLLTSDKWLRLRGYRSLREGSGDFGGILGDLSLDLLCELGERAFHPSAALHDGVKAAVLCARKCRPEPHHRLSLCSLITTSSYEDKVRALAELSRNCLNTHQVHVVEQRGFREREAGEVMLQVSSLPHAVKNSGRTVSNYADVVVGIQTNSDERHVRYVWQVPPGQPGWRLHAKGGGYARWCGLNRWVINWDQGRDTFFKTDLAISKAEEWANRAGWCYTWFANGALGVRSKAPGVTFGRAAASGVFPFDERIVAFLNSRIASVVSRTMGGKIQLPEGVVRKLPAPPILDAISQELINAAKSIKLDLVRADIRDALFDPTSLRLPSETLILEALLLALEGVLEGQVERALSMTGDDSTRLSAVGGAPAGWFPLAGQVAEHRLWGLIPQRYCYLREMLSGLENRPGSCPPSTSGDLSGIRDLLNNRSRMYPRSYVLPTTGVLEHLCRMLERHPFDVAAHTIELLQHERGLKCELTMGALCSAVARDVLLALGHSWGSNSKKASSLYAEVLGESEICSIAKICGERMGLLYLIADSPQTWVRKEFVPWQERIFCRKSPLVVMSQAGDSLMLRHRWGD